jgi:hypothetical protein
MTVTPDTPVTPAPAGTAPGAGAVGHGQDGRDAHDSHDSHDGHGAHEMAGEALGPIDVAAWTAALLGAGIGALVVMALWVAISA